MPQILTQEPEAFTEYQWPFEPAPPVKAPSFVEGLRAGIAQESDIANLWELHKRKTFPQNLSYDLVTSLKARNLWEDRDLYVGSYSDEEVDARTLRIAKERVQRDVINRAGLAGYAYAAAGGALSPTTLIPLIRGATMVKSAVKTGLAVGTSVAAQEAVLFANQETRTPGEAAFSIAASTVLGGILGAAGYSLNKGHIEKMSDDMADPTGTRHITTYARLW